MLQSFSLLPQNDITSNKVLFPEHLPLSKIQAGIKNGSFLQGTFRASRDNYLEATVFVHGEGEDGTEVCESTVLSSVNEQREQYFSLLEELHPSVSHQVLIQGLQNLNRAVHQDVVALQLFPRSQWVAPSSVVLQDEGEPKGDNAEEEEEKIVNLCLHFYHITDEMIIPRMCVLLTSCGLNEMATFSRCFILGAM